METIGIMENALICKVAEGLQGLLSATQRVQAWNPVPKALPAPETCKQSEFRYFVSRGSSSCSRPSLPCRWSRRCGRFGLQMAVEAPGTVRGSRLFIPGLI